MKKLLILLSFFTLISCNAQDKKEEDNKNSKNLTKTNKPKIDYKVNKEYDENGNLIRLDSTYTYYYSNIDKDAMMKDSIFQKINAHFNKHSPFGESFYDDFFQDDSFNEEDFFQEDFFRGNFKKNREMMNKMMQKMDSLKNQFFIKEFPLDEKENE